MDNPANGNRYRVTVDYIDRYEMVIDAFDGQDALLQVERGEAHPTTHSAVFVSKSVQPIHIKPVVQVERKIA